MEQNNWGNQSSMLIGSLIMNINRLQLIQPTIIGIINDKNEELLISEDNFQDQYVNATTVDGIKALLEAERKKYKKAIKEVSDKIKENMARMNLYVGRCNEDMTKLPQPISRLEDMIDNYETELEENNERMLEFEDRISTLNQEIENIRRGNVNPPTPKALTLGQINFKNNQKVHHICNTIKVANSLTANAFNNLIRLTIHNPDNCPPNSIKGWRRKAMDAYAIKIAPAGKPPNHFEDGQFLEILNCIRKIVRNNALGAGEVPDHL